MISFDDFDAWGDAVSGAHLRLTCDSVEHRRWTLARLELGDVVLQVAAEGGGNLCYGANIHPGPTLFVPLTHAERHVANGAALDADSLFVIPQGADFSIRVRHRAHAWCAIALPADTPGAPQPAAGSRNWRCPPGTAAALRGLAQRIAAELGSRSERTAAHAAAGAELAAAAAACLAVSPPSRRAPGRPRLDRPAIIRRAMAAIETGPIMPPATALARAIGVTDRTLLRAFRETFDTPPKRYLMLRELHGIRRSLLAGGPGRTTVADILTRHGIWEFGRFAGRYRAHFGELPSQTLARGRA